MTAPWLFLTWQPLRIPLGMLPLLLALTSPTLGQTNTLIFQPGASGEPPRDLTYEAAIPNEILLNTYNFGGPRTFIQPPYLSSKHIFFSRYFSRKPKSQIGNEFYNSATQLGSKPDLLTLPRLFNWADISHQRTSLKPARTNIDTVADNLIIGTWEITHSGDDFIYETCFPGDDVTGSCETCGYYDSESEAQGSYDCITCAEGYEIDVVFDDCSGFCVPLGTAAAPLSISDCRIPGKSTFIVEFNKDGRIVINEFQEDKLRSIHTFKYRVEMNQILLADGSYYGYVNGELKSFEKVRDDESPSLFFERSNNLLVLTVDGDREEHVRSDRSIVSPPDLEPVTEVETLIGTWKISYPWSNETSGYRDLIKISLDGNLVKIQTGPGDEPIVVTTSRYSFDDGLLTEFDQEYFYFDQDNHIWIKTPSYSDASISSIYELNGLIVLVPEEQAYSPSGILSAWSGDIVLPEGLASAVSPSEIPSAPLDNYISLLDGTGIHGKLVFTTCMGMGGNCAMVSVDMDARKQIQLPDGSEPAWSPDGNKIVYLGEGGLFVVDQDGTNKERIGQFSYSWVQSPTWSPDGNKIVCHRLNMQAMNSMYDEKNQLREEYHGAFIYPFEIVVFNLLDGTEEVVAAGKWPTWTGDGQKIIYTSTSSGGLVGSKILTLDLITAKIDTLAHGFQAILSPDGKQIVFGRPDATRTKDFDPNMEKHMEELLGPGMGRPINIYVRTLESNEEQLLVTTKIPVGTLSGFFFGGIKFLHSWSRDSKTFLHSDSESLSSEATVALYDISKMKSTKIPATIINPSWYDSAIPSFIKNKRDDNLPHSYRLEQNFPNPFNSSTVFTFALPSKELVSITVYNLSGQRVARFINKVYNPGYHETKWEGTGLASGIYFFEMTAGNVKLARKMLKLR